MKIILPASQLDKNSRLEMEGIIGDLSVMPSSPDETSFVIGERLGFPEIKMTSETDQLPQIEFLFLAHSIKVVSHEDSTKILPLPNNMGALRLFGITAWTVSSDAGHEESSFVTYEVSVKASIKSFHETYEDACAAEMQEQIEKSNEEQE